MSVISESIESEEKEVLKCLMGFGLKPYEAEAYLDILRHGASTVREILRRTRIPYGRIYEVLKSLFHMGYIIESPGRPKMYIAIPPHILIKKVIKKEKEKLDKLKEHAAIVEQMLLRFAYGCSIEYIFSILMKSQDIIKFSSRQISRTKSKLVICLDTDRCLQIQREVMPSDVWASYLRILERALNRGVYTYLLVSSDKEVPLQTMKNILYGLLTPNILEFKGKNLKIRYARKPVTPFNIYDDERVLIKLRDPSRDGSYTCGIFIINSRLATLLMEKFKALWNECKGF